MTFKDASVRPPVFEEMYEDIERMIAALASRYCDQTSSMLEYEELRSVARHKLCQLLTKGELVRQVSRRNFFRFLKAAVANSFRSLIQKHRFTGKRTGQKPPPRKVAGATATALQAVPEVSQESDYRKHIEVSLDDEEAGVQVRDTAEPSDVEAQILEDYLSVLSPVEQLVLKEMHEPGLVARTLADLDSRLKRKPGSVRIEIRHEHMAEGLGMDIELFEEAVLSIRAKIASHNAMTDQDQRQMIRRNAVIQQLSSVFGVQVPPNLDDVVLRRLFTIAARDQYQKVNSQVAELLEEIGAKPPKPHADGWACFGILYKRSDRRCVACDLNKSCSAEAANIGLGKITISPKLLGARNTRYPVGLPSKASVHRLGETAEPEQLDIVAYLNSNFMRVQKGAQTFYIHKPHGDRMSRNRKLLFCLEKANPLCIRFCNPKHGILPKLSGKPKAYYPPDGISQEELIALIEQHSDEIYRLEEMYG